MENNQPLISIIVPIYNAEKYLRACVNSIMSQTYSNLEIVLVDDGATDSSGMICDELSKFDDRILVVHTKNGGVSSARNVGLNVAIGEYIMFVDSDDTIIPESIELMFESSQKHNADIVSAGVIDSNNEIYFPGDECVWDKSEPLMQSLKDHPYTFSACSKLYRKSIIDQTRFSREIRVNEDTLFLFEILCKQPKIVNLKKKVYYYRQNVESASRTPYSEKFEDILRVADKKQQLITESFPELLPLAKNMMFKARMNLLKILCLRTQNEQKNLEGELIKYIKKNHRFYIPMSPYDNRWLQIIRCDLYYIYKFAYRFKMKLNSGVL